VSRRARPNGLARWGRAGRRGRKAKVVVNKVMQRIRNIESVFDAYRVTPTA
jgi:hypothetical protein